MDVGMMMVFASYGWDSVGDDQVWDEEIRLARLAADSGFDVLWSAEHHFFDYSFCPDNLQLMTYLAAACPGVGLGTAAVIVPWHDPLRVAEQAAVLDLLCKGRLRLGLGRGLAQFRSHAHGRCGEQVRQRSSPRFGVPRHTPAPVGLYDRGAAKPKQSGCCRPHLYGPAG